MSAGAPATAPPAAGRGGILRHTAFLRLWVGATASGLATWAMPFILGLALLDRSLTAAALGLALATRTVGFLIAVPVGGVLADRYSRRAVVRWSGLTAAAATPFLAVGLGRSVLLLAAAAAVVGAGQGACRPAFQALTAEVVEPARRQQANAAMTLAVRVTTLGAPAVAALLAAVAPVAVLLVGTGLLWLVAALAPGAGSDAPVEERTPRRSGVVREFAEGVREARSHPWLLPGLAALCVVITAGYSATSVALPLISRDRYGAVAVLAAATTAYVVGALVGAAVIARWRPRNAGWTALAGLAAYGFAPLSLWLDVPAAVVVSCYLVAGVGIELFNVPWFTSLQREVAPRKLARVSSLDFLLSYGLAPVGLALMAPAIGAFGTGPVLATCAALCFLAPLAAARAPGARHFSRPDPPG